MKPISSIIAAAAMALGAVTGASAQNQMGAGQGSTGLSNPQAVVNQFSVQTVGPVFNELGVPWEVRELNSGKQFLFGQADGLNFVVFFTACRETACAGMQTLVMFNDANVNAQTVQAFNSRFPFATTGVDQQGGAYVSRYDIADFGVPRGNIAVSLVNTIMLSKQFMQEIANAHQTVSLEGYASDLSSGHLNNQQLGHFGVTPEAGNESGQHKDGFEEVAQLIQTFLEDETAPRNKITNVKN